MFHVEHRRERDNRFSQALVDGAAELGVPLSQPLALRYISYFRELQIWNEKTNLTSMRDEREIAVKHFLDSLACSKAFGQFNQVRLLDLGSGAGFPGLPLKLMHPEIELALLEPSQKKTAFLRHVVGTLDIARTVVISKRIEEFSRTSTDQTGFTHIITRAVNMASLLSCCLSLLKPNGAIILCRTKPLEREFPLGRLQIRREIAYTLPLGYGPRVLTVLEPQPDV